MSVRPHAAASTRERVDALLREAHAVRHEDVAACAALAEQAHAEAVRIDHAGGVARALVMRALARVIQGDLGEDTEALLLQAAALARSLGDLRCEADAVNLLGHVCDDRGDARGALALRDRCLALRRAAGDRTGEAGALHNLALAWRGLHRAAEALDTFQASLELAETLDDGPARAYALASIAHLMIDLDDPAAALPDLHRALEINAGTRDRAHECTLRVLLGRALAMSGRDAEARAQLQAAVALARRTGNRADLCGALLAHAEELQDQGMHAAADAALADAQTALTGLQHADLQAHALALAGRAAGLRGHADLATATLARALEQARTAADLALEVRVLRWLADAHDVAGEPAAALAQFRAFHAAQGRLHGREGGRRLRQHLSRTEWHSLRQDARAAELRASRLAGELAEQQASAQRQEALLAELAQQSRLLEQLAREDGLTGVANRRWLDLQLARECERARRFDHPLSVAMIDVDHFKALNDRFGHALGDEVLRRVAHLLRSACRASDELGRYGGEEFLLILAETPLSGALPVCEKLRERVRSHDWSALHPALAGVTVSIGLASASGAQVTEALAQRADERLYEAKAAGRDRTRG